MFYGRRGKYNNRWTIYNGVKYQSKFEADYARELDVRIKGKDIRGWQRQVVIPITFDGELLTKYKVDFVIKHNDKSLEYIECKGYFDNYSKLRWKALQIYCQHEMPGVKLTVVRS